MQKKNTIQLTEGVLRNLISEAIQNVLLERDKEHQKEYARQWKRDKYASNPEFRASELERNKQYRPTQNANRRDRYANDEEYREQMKARAKEYGANNKDKIAASARERRAKQKEKDTLNNAMTDNFTPKTDITQQAKSLPIDDTMAANNTQPMENEDREKVVKNLLNRFLSPKEMEILKRNFGLFGYPKEEMDEIGEQFGLTFQRVRTIREKALRKLQDAAMENRKLYQFVIDHF